MPRADLELNIWSDPNLVSTTRRYIEEIYEKVLVDDTDAISRIALAAHELLENAVKFSSDGAARITIHLEAGTETDSVIITVVNQTAPEHILGLREAMGDMAKEPNPFRYYQGLMKSTGRRQDGSGLGLARIRAEGDMGLSFQCNGQEVQLEARAEIEKRRAA